VLLEVIHLPDSLLVVPFWMKTATRTKLVTINCLTFMTSGIRKKEKEKKKVVKHEEACFSTLANQSRERRTKRHAVGENGPRTHKNV